MNYGQQKEQLRKHLNMKEYNDISPKISREHRNFTAAKHRDYTEAVRVLKEKKYPFESSVEIFHDKKVTRQPNMVGVTVGYPTLLNPTHMFTRIYSLDIGEKEFGRQLKNIFKEFKKKIKDL